MIDPAHATDPVYLTQQLWQGGAADRQEAARRLDALGPDAVAQIVDAAAREHPITAPKRLAACAALAAAGAVAGGRIWSPIEGGLAGATLGAGLMWAAMRLEARAGWPYVIQHLASREDREVVRRLLTIVGDAGAPENHRKVAARAVGRRLRQIPAGAIDMSADERQALASALSLPDADAVIALIRAAGDHGVVEATDRVRRIARGHWRLNVPAAHRARVRAAAGRVLPILERLEGLSTQQRTWLLPEVVPQNWREALVAWFSGRRFMRRSTRDQVRDLMRLLEGEGIGAGARAALILWQMAHRNEAAGGEGEALSGEFVLGALEAFREQGDECVLPCVEHLAETDAVDVEGVLIRDLAREVLPVVRARAEEQKRLAAEARQAALLLRPAEADDGATLLRPSQPEEPDTLLRPAPEVEGPADPVLQAEVKRLTRQLGSFRRAKREEAARRLDELGPEAVPQMVGLTLAADRRAKVRWGVLYFVLMFAGQAIVGCYVPSHGWRHMAAIVLLSTFAMAVAYRLSTARWQRALAEYLSSLSDPRSAPALVSATGYYGAPRAMQRAICQAAARVLREMPPDDRRLVPFDSTAVARALSVRDPDAAIAAVQVAAHVGATQTLPTIRRIAQGRWRRGVPAARDPRVRAVALEVLPELERLAGLADTKSVLLRPADAPAGEALLRPAQPAGESDAALLLRASGADPEAAGPGD